MVVSTAVSFARIHWQNLANFGIIPLSFSDPGDWSRFEQGDSLFFPKLRENLQKGRAIEVVNRRTAQTHKLTHRLSHRQIEMILAGGLIRLTAEKLRARGEQARATTK
jgi:aconitate hydratase